METKYCQSCIERGYQNPGIATREWQTGVFYCDDCFNAVLENLTNIAPATVTKHTDSLPSNIKAGPVLDALYQILEIPPELQFDRVDLVNRNHDKLWNFHAPAIVNRSLESIAEEIEQLSMALFHIKYRIEPLDERISKLKEERRKEKNLIGYKDSKEEYAKDKTTRKAQTKAGNDEKIAKSLGMTVEAYKQMMAGGIELEKKKRERQFNILAGNCATCGGKADVILKEKGEDVPYCTACSALVGAR